MPMDNERFWMEKLILYFKRKHIVFDILKNSKNNIMII
jgi:hypothetical protein